MGQSAGRKSGAASSGITASNGEESKPMVASPAVPAVCLNEDCSDCSICMDARTEISFLPCAHSLCFHCACRLLVRGNDAATCPFCRQPVESVTAMEGARSSSIQAGKGKEEVSVTSDGGVSPSAAVSLER